MKPLVRVCCVVLLAGLAAPAAAQSNLTVASARQAGIVGERYDGYLGFAAGASDAVRRQVGALNIRRRSLYTGLASRRRVTVQEVGIAAGCELLAQVRVGESYMLNDGVWHRRAAGEPAPAPTYCGR